MKKKIKHNCIKCGKERELSRQSIWGIKKGKTSGMCGSCSKKGCGAGKHNSPETEFKKGTDVWNTGIPHSKKHKENLKKAWNKRKENGMGVPWNKGKKRKDIAGEKHWAWKGGITSENQRVRASIEYKFWRVAVFERDSYTCIWCGQEGGVLNADHIKPFCLFPELRLVIDNGRTLCKKCHDTIGWKRPKTLQGHNGIFI